MAHQEHLKRLSLDNLSLPWPLLAHKLLEKSATVIVIWGILPQKCRAPLAHDYRKKNDNTTWTRETGLKFDAPDIWDPWQALAEAQSKDLHDQPVSWRRVRSGSGMGNNDVMAKLLYILVPAVCIFSPDVRGWQCRVSNDLHQEPTHEG